MYTVQTQHKNMGVQGWLSGSFSDDGEQELWNVLGSTQPCIPELLENKVLPLTTQCVRINNKT